MTSCNETESKKQLIIHHETQNLLSVSLTPSQIKILSEGLKFTPNLQCNLPKIEKEFKDLIRKLSLLEFCSEEDTSEGDTTNSSLVKNKTYFCHPQNETMP